MLEHLAFQRSINQVPCSLAQAIMIFHASLSLVAFSTSVTRPLSHFTLSFKDLWRPDRRILHRRSQTLFLTRRIKLDLGTENESTGHRKGNAEQPPQPLLGLNQASLCLQALTLMTGNKTSISIFPNSLINSQSHLCQLYPYGIPFGFQTSSQGKQWIQLAGHQGNFQAGEAGSVLKKLDALEQECYQSLMTDSLKKFVPEYKGNVEKNGESILFMNL
ncbi:hypothetical protein RRG08_012876 [Elysia crispata]|uniref:Uncharacterized protein n=1 Tax=Elysia crispata TaxID=231223 RepID=A0AAE1E4H1_9GAST|nr:hypothetical protein RRG08_012876 [Elysia crispata]